MLLTMLLGLTNGHLATAMVMHAPSMVPPAARDQVGTIMALSITLGITVGVSIALLAFPYLQS